jgi:hypothetical protein
MYPNCTPFRLPKTPFEKSEMAALCWEPTILKEDAPLMHQVSNG